MALIVPGLFLTVALPAYAFSPGTGEDQFATSAVDGLKQSNAQSVNIDDAAVQTTVVRDGYGATSEEEIAAARAAAEAEAARQARATVFTSAEVPYVVGERASGDDYPYPYEATDNQGGGLSPFRYYYRECVDFVAWRMNRDIGSTSAPYALTWGNGLPNGSAYSWASGWNGASGSTPVAGAVAWFSYNHVAYVQSVNADGSVTLEEYNWNSSHAYHTRTVSASSVDLYLYR